VGSLGRSEALNGDEDGMDITVPANQRIKCRSAKRSVAGSGGVVFGVRG